METELGKFIGVFIMVILPIGIIFLAIGNRFEGHNKEIKELENRIDELNEEIRKLKKD